MAVPACMSKPDRVAYEFTYTEDNFETLRDRLYNWTGIKLQAEKKQMLYSRLSKRLRSLNLPSFESYQSYLLQDNHDEKAKFISCLTTNLTSFFREPHHFEHLRTYALPLLQQHPLTCRKTGKPTLKIWSTACSSGEEPYSIAATIDAFRHQHKSSAHRWYYRLLATDIDQDILQKAETGSYDLPNISSIPAVYRNFLGLSNARPTSQTPDSISVDIPLTLKQKISFRNLNLTQKWHFQGPFDIIFCRNVLIYFDRQTQIELIKRMTAMLRPGGWLYIGHAEFFDANVSSLKTDGRTIYRKEGEF